MPNPLQHATAARDRVGWNQLVAYGMGGLIPIALFNIAGQLMGLLGNISLGLNAFWLGVVMIVPKLWDAISDPVVGHLSDNTRSRWGRRRPYLLLGGLAVAISFVAMWWVPRGDWVRNLFPSDVAYNWFQLSYILGGLLVFFTACTVFEIPHGALGMELSNDYHERTRLFSAKSFLGNLFAMGTPWLIFLAGLDFFRGSGDLADGMRYVSLFIAVLLVPLSCWWFLALREPGAEIAQHQARPAFWSDMRTTASNRTFLRLIAIIFTLAMGFNFVNLFNYYITIFYLYGGDAVEAGHLLGINGTVWAVTGLLAVFPLNWMSQRLGKNATLLAAILLMAAAQLAKIVCYNPQLPYLVLLPTVLLSTGMLMFFTLGASMVGDVCDEDELHTGKRAEGSYYSVYWWFIKMGTAFASFVTGALLVYTHFDEQQNVVVDALRGSLAATSATDDASAGRTPPANYRDRSALGQQIAEAIDTSEQLASHWRRRLETHPSQRDHTHELIDRLAGFRRELLALQNDAANPANNPAILAARLQPLLEATHQLKQQAPSTLLRMRIVEIGLPLVLSCVSMLLTVGYPLTESRCYAIKQALDQRHASAARP